MPTVTINRRVLEKNIGKKLPEEELKDRISMLGTDLEQVDDDEIIVEIFPNRPDMLSEQGFGRALSSFLGIRTGLRKYDLKHSGEKVIVSKDMKKVRPYTVCALVKNLKLDDEKVREIIQIQEKLHITFCRKRNKAAIGIYPLEKIKLPIYFCARKPKDIVFRPLEWKKEIDAKEVLLKHPTGIKYKDLVKDLNKYAIFHDADNNILSFTPIINSHRTGKITDTTKEAFLEVSGFDLHTANYVLNIMVAALVDMGATVEQMDVVYPDKTMVTPDMDPSSMKVDLDYINRWLGLDLSKKDFKKYCERMGFGYNKGTVKVPAYRPDILHPVDIAEDIAIAYGYENVDAILPTKATTAKEDRFEAYQNKIARIFTGLNMLEVSSYHLSNEHVQYKNMLTHPKHVVRLANSLSKEHDIMRSSLLAQLMQILGSNTHHEYPQKIFEIGTVFVKDPKQDIGVREDTHLAAAIAADRASYTDIRQIFEYLFRMIGKEIEIKETSHPSYIKGRCAKIILEGKDIGHMGEMHPKVITNFGVDMVVVGGEINLSQGRNPFN